MNIYNSYKQILKDVGKVEDRFFCRILPVEWCNKTYLCHSTVVGNESTQYCSMFGPITGYTARLETSMEQIGYYFEKLVRMQKIYIFPFKLYLSVYLPNVIPSFFSFQSLQARKMQMDTNGIFQNVTLPNFTTISPRDPGTKDTFQRNMIKYTMATFFGLHEHTSFIKTLIPKLSLNTFSPQNTMI